MCLCENEVNDKGCCWYGGSFVGVWVFGIIQAMATFISIYQVLFFPVEERTQDIDSLNDEQKQQETWSIKMTGWYTCVMILFGMAPFILVLVKRESLGARLWLFASVMVLCCFQVVTQIIVAVQYYAYTQQFLREGNDKASDLYGGIAIRVIINACIFVFISPVILYFIYWKFYSNLRDRIEVSIARFNSSTNRVN